MTHGALLGLSVWDCSLVLFYLPAQTQPLSSRFLQMNVSEKRIRSLHFRSEHVFLIRWTSLFSQNKNGGWKWEKIAPVFFFFFFFAQWFQNEMLKHVSSSLTLCVLLFLKRRKKCSLSFLRKSIESEHFPPFQKKQRSLQKEKIMRVWGFFFPTLFGEEDQGAMSGFLSVDQQGFTSPGLKILQSSLPTDAVAVLGTLVSRLCSPCSHGYPKPLQPIPAQVPLCRHLASSLTFTAPSTISSMRSSLQKHMFFSFPWFIFSRQD